MNNRRQTSNVDIFVCVLGYIQAALIGFALTNIISWTIWIFVPILIIMSLSLIVILFMVWLGLAMRHGG